MITGIFRDFLRKTYHDDPNSLGNFVSSSFVFARVRQRYWRGYRKANDTATTVDGADVSQKDILTNPSWKLAPKELLQEFQTFSTGVDQAIQQYAFSPSEQEDSATAIAASAVLVGGGRYMVDVSVWPRLEGYLIAASTKWGEAADRWCTEEGHEKLHALLKEQSGDELYEKIKVLVPDRQTLRAKYALDYRTAPVRIVDEDKTESAAKSGRRDEIVDLLDLAVRSPREEAAAAWEDFAGRLAYYENGAWHPFRPMRKERGTDKVKAGERVFQERMIRSIHKKTEALGRGERYLDPDLRLARDRILKEFPGEPGPAKVVAQALANDSEAVRVAAILSAAAATARDERGMVEGLGAAFTAGTL